MLNSIPALPEARNESKYNFFENYGYLFVNPNVKVIFEKFSDLPGAPGPWAPGPWAPGPMGPGPMGQWVPKGPWVQRALPWDPMGPPMGSHVPHPWAWVPWGLYEKIRARAKFFI